MAVAGIDQGALEAVRHAAVPSLHYRNKWPAVQSPLPRLASLRATCALSWTGSGAGWCNSIALHDLCASRCESQRGQRKLCSPVQDALLPCSSLYLIMSCAPHVSMHMPAFSHTWQHRFVRLDGLTFFKCRLSSHIACTSIPRYNPFTRNHTTLMAIHASCCASPHVLHAGCSRHA
jgi:hypothetical protein